MNGSNLYIDMVYLDNDYNYLDFNQQYLHFNQQFNEIRNTNRNLTNYANLLFANQLNDMYNSMQTVLEHNWKLLQEQSYSEVITPL